MLLGVDVGGTFTDAVLFDGRSVFTAKAATTPDDQSLGVLEAVEQVLGRASARPQDIALFAHGMTVGTNALLEERGARTGLIATEGFADVLEIGRQDRPNLYRLCAPKPEPLVDEADRFEVRERVSAAGVVEELHDEEIERVVAAVRDSGIEAVAVCLLFSHAEPDHERAIVDRLRSELDLHVSASHQVLAQFREYERFSTTVIDAYLSPLLGHYLARLGESAEARGIPRPAVMLSSGGVAPFEEAARAGAWSVLSGPAGGAVGAGVLAQLDGDGNVLGFDMGGTSCDVCVVEGGRVRKTDSRKLAGRVIQLPMVDVHTVGAGGGSIAWRDSGGALRVGPHSAGADPGPACYGRGGTEPTVTDANLMLGNLSHDGALAGGVELDSVAAERAVEGLAAALGIDPLDAAEGIVRVANVEMVRALRVVTVERGIDPRGFALMPFGGAGPMHAAAIAAELGIERILCPRASGVLSALGLVASERRRDVARTVMLRGAELSAEQVATAVESLRRSAAEGFSESARLELTYELRYRGQAFELGVSAGPRPSPEELGQLFADEHERRYGYRNEAAEIELVTIKLALVEPGPDVRPHAATAGAELHRASRSVRFGTEWLQTTVLRGEPTAGMTADGPCVFELPEATLVLPPGWSAEVYASGTIAAQRAGGAS